MRMSSPTGTRGAVGVAVVLSCLAIGFLSPVSAAEGDGVDLEKMVMGRVTYRIYCTSCHGPTAQGDGNLAQYMNVPPTNLTQLSAGAEDGVFPAETLHALIDGRGEGVRGHGAKEMPVWGDVFKSLDTVGDDEDLVNLKIAELVVYLQSIQTGTASE